MITMSFLWLSILGVGWIAAALIFGLWWGERGRRHDTQRILHVAPASKPEVDPGEGQPEHVALERDTAELRERYIQDLIREGHTRKAAEKDWEKVRAQLDSGAGGY